MTIYLIILRDLISNKVTSIYIKLTNKAFSYLLNTINTIEIITTLNTNPFTYNNSTILYYILTVFIRIIINIKALRKSITSYS